MERGFQPVRVLAMALKRRPLAPLRFSDIAVGVPDETSACGTGPLRGGADMLDQQKGASGEQKHGANQGELIEEKLKDRVGG